MNDSANSTGLMDAPAVQPAAGSWVRLALDNWMERHRLPFNFWIHMAGIPLAVAGVFLFAVVDWYWALGALVLGYVFQWLGHLAEGNDVGEWAAIKSLFGLPYVAIAPRWQSAEESKCGMA